MATVKKAQDGKKVSGPTYKNLRMGVANKRSEEGNYPRGGYGASKEDSASYRFGYGRGLKGEKEFPGEGAVQKMGRWEGQNAAKADRDAKAAVPKKKNGGALKAVDPSKKKSLGKLPTAVRNKMGFQKNGGVMKAMSGTKMMKAKKK